MIKVAHPNRGIVDLISCKVNGNFKKFDNIHIFCDKHNDTQLKIHTNEWNACLNLTYKTGYVSINESESKNEIEVDNLHYKILLDEDFAFLILEYAIEKSMYNDLVVGKYKFALIFQQQDFKCCLIDDPLLIVENLNF
jgi:hypothetical protein